MRNVVLLFTVALATSVSAQSPLPPADLTIMGGTSFPPPDSDRLVMLDMTNDPSGYYYTSSGTYGQTATWHPTGGWNDTGYVRLTLPTIPDNHAALGQFNWEGGARSRLNVGFLYRFGPTITQNDRGLGWKNLIVHRGGGDGGPRIMQIWHSFFGGQWDTQLSNNISPQDPTHPSGGVNFGPDGGFHGEWFWLEAEMYASGAGPGHLTLYITTEGGTYDEQPMFVDQTIGTGGFSYIERVGSYGGWMPTSGPGDWYDIGLVIIDDEYIGPPPGFGGN